LRLVVDYLEGTLSVATWDDSAWIGGTASRIEYLKVCDMYHTTIVTIAFSKQMKKKEKGKIDR